MRHTTSKLGLASKIHRKIFYIKFSIMATCRIKFTKMIVLFCIGLDIIFLGLDFGVLGS